MAFTPAGVLTDITGKEVKSISIAFDEGQDASGGPDSFGLAVLDNIDVNGTLVGSREGQSDNDEDNGTDNKDKGKDNGNHGKHKDKGHVAVTEDDD